MIRQLFAFERVRSAYGHVVGYNVGYGWMAAWVIAIVLGLVVGCGGIGNSIADVQPRDMGDGTTCYLLSGGTGAATGISCVHR